MKKHLIYSVFCLFFLIMVSCGPERTKEEIAFDRLDSLFTAWENTKAFNGNLYIQWEDTVIIRSFGVSRNDNKMALTPTDVFYLGSLAKQFTAMGVMTLVDSGAVSLEDTLGRYFPEFPAFTYPITIRQMLNHTSGLPDYYDMGLFKSGFKNEDVINAMKGITKLDFPPGEQYSYSNSAYVLLSVIIERVTGERYASYMKRKVFSPLEMTYTMVYDTTRPNLPPRALGHAPNGNLDDYNAYTTGGGGIFSNIPDIIKWIDALDRGDLLSNTLYKEMYSPAKLNDGSLSAYGFGWALDLEHPEIYRHSGSLAGYRTYMYRDTEQNTRVVVLSNFTNNATELTLQVLKILNG